MSYLLDRKTKRKKFFSITLFVIFLFILFYFRTPVFDSLSYMSHIIFRPVVILGNNIGESFSNFTSYFNFKKSLSEKNKNLKLEIRNLLSFKAFFKTVIKLRWCSLLANPGTTPPHSA